MKKEYIIFSIIIFIAIIVSVGATNMYHANAISYSRNNVDTNVNDALDVLFESINNKAEVKYIECKNGSASFVKINNVVIGHVSINGITKGTSVDFCTELPYPYVSGSAYFGISGYSMIAEGTVWSGGIRYNSTYSSGSGGGSFMYITEE